MQTSDYIVLSVKPKWVSKILAGEKDIELRKGLSGNIRTGTKAIIYSSTPSSAVVGIFTIGGVERDAPHVLWEKYQERIGATHSEFSAYMGNRTSGVAILVENPIKIESISLRSLRNLYNFSPPVSWRYLKISELNFLKQFGVE